MSVDNYAMVDFNAMIQIVDAVGGIELELTREEVSVANDYVKTMCEANGEPYEKHEIKSSGPDSPGRLSGGGDMPGTAIPEAPTTLDARTGSGMC